MAFMENGSSIESSRSADKFDRNAMRCAWSRSYTSLLNVDAAICVTVVYLLSCVSACNSGMHSPWLQQPTHCNTCAAALVTALAVMTHVAYDARK